MARRKPPAQKPGKSVQDVQTPPEFVEAVERRFGRLDFDLACDENNMQADDGFQFPKKNALEEDWILSGNVDWLTPDWNFWLNPPYSQIGPWVKRASEASFLLRRGKIFVLVPASVGSNWFRDHVHDKAMVLFLETRLKFVGHSQPYPKDLVLICYGQGLKGFDRWHWEAKRESIA